jgi:hypothetical protein
VTEEDVEAEEDRKTEIERDARLPIALRIGCVKRAGPKIIPAG